MIIENFVNSDLLKLAESWEKQAHAIGDEEAYHNPARIEVRKALRLGAAKIREAFALIEAATALQPVKETEETLVSVLHAAATSIDGLAGLVKRGTREVLYERDAPIISKQCRDAAKRFGG